MNGALAGAAVGLWVVVGCGVALGETRWVEASELLPGAATNGRTMDAEFVDVDGDGRLDVVVASEYGQNAVLRGTEGGGFEYAAGMLPIGRLGDCEDIGFGDLDSDGRVDLVFACEDSKENELYVQTRAGVFEDRTSALGSGGVSNCVLVHDFDGDGRLDVMFGNSGGAHGPQGPPPGAVNELFLGDGRGGFAPDRTGIVPDDARVTQDMELGDLDGDGDLDIVCGNEDGNRIWMREGAVLVDRTDVRAPQGGAPVETREVDLADVDGDGDLDVFFANVGWRQGVDASNRLWINDGTGRFADESDRLPAAKEFTLDVDFADVDGDGDADVVLAQLGPGTPPVRVLINDGAGRFSDETAAWVPVLPLCNAIDVEAADVNGDGLVDLYVGNHQSMDRLLLSRGGGG